MLLLHNCHLSHLSVCLLVQKVYCGKMADWIWIPFRVVSTVTRGMGILHSGDDHRREGAVSGVRGEFGASHCNQMGRQCTLPKLLWEDLLIFSNNVFTKFFIF